MKFHNKDRFFLFTYFIVVILLGSVLLSIHGAWNGVERLSYVDALFTSTSAVCVTGLVSVDTAQYSVFGKTVIMFLIQFGGLGIITFLTVYLANSKGKISLANRKLIGDFYVSSVERNPLNIVRHIVILTIVVELAGALCMFPVFRWGTDSAGEAVFMSVFHSISAFCNAGFSTFSDNLERYVTNPTVNIAVMSLIILGGLGFVVIEDIFERALGKRRRLALHTRLVLATTALLIVGGAAVFLIFEWKNGYDSLSPVQKILASLFQSVTPRTAGFDTVNQAALGYPSKVFTMFLMYVGASPASTGGGIKTTTFFLVLVMILRGSEAREEIRIFGKKVSLGSISRGMMFALRAIAVLAAAILALTVTELFLGSSGDKLFIEVAFEAFSAFGTVGLSLGITPYLTAAGKVIIILTMFAGRVGMSALAVSVPRRIPRRIADLPEEEVLIG
jgi:trk system potassium uptake protein TrkH